MGGLSGATIAVVEDADANTAVVKQVGLATLMKDLRGLHERGADYALLRAVESGRRGSAVQFVDESDGVPPLREIVKDQEPEDIGRVPVAVVRRAQQKFAEARKATDDRAIFVHMVDLLLHIPENKNFDFAGAGATNDYWAAGKLELRYTYLLHGVSLALEKAIVPGYVAKSVEISDLAPYDDAEEIARARRPRRSASLSATDAGAHHDFCTLRQQAGRRHSDQADLAGFWLQNRLRPHLGLLGARGDRAAGQLAAGRVDLDEARGVGRVVREGDALPGGVLAYERCFCQRRRAERAAMRDDGAERSTLGRRARVGVGVARAGGRRFCGGPGEGEGNDQAEHCLFPLESPLFSLSDATDARRATRAGYQAPRGFVTGARV